MDNLAEFILANWGLVLALVIILALIARSLIMPARINPVESMEMIRLMNQQNALVVDVRGNDEYQKGHILNSMHIPLALIDSKQSELAAFKNEQIILVCRSGSRSYQAGLTLKKLGFENLHNLKGGVMAWQQAGLPLTTQPTKGKHKPKNKDDATPTDSTAVDENAAVVETAAIESSAETNKDTLTKNAEGSSSAKAEGSLSEQAEGSSSAKAEGSSSAKAEGSSSEKAKGSSSANAKGSTKEASNSDPLLDVVDNSESLTPKQKNNKSLNNNSLNNEVVVYTTKKCPFCDRAVNLLTKKGIGYTEIRIDGEPLLREEMESKSMRKTVPQIFVGEKHVGGFDDMYMLESEGRLNTVFGLA